MNKIAIVTGANSGLGFETAKAFAKSNLKVIMACRNMQKAENAKNEILKVSPKANLEIIPLDLSDFDSIKTFATMYSEKYSQLDILVNNAGIMTHKKSYNENGIESNFGTNYVGHFLLTNLLFPIVSKTENARIVSLSSIAHKFTNKVPLNDNNLKALKGFDAYSQSKLACLMFSYELQKRLTAINSSVISVCAHPGVSITSIGQNLPKILLKMQDKLGSLIFSDSENGAKATLFASLNNNVKGGDYFGPNGLLEFKGKVQKAESTKLSKNETVSKSLWTFSEELTGGEFVV